MLPSVGPLIYSVPAFAQVTIGAGLVVTAPPWRWPSARFVTGWLVVPRSGLTVDAAALELSITDEDAQQIISDGIGGTFAAPGLAMSGLGGWRPFPMQRPVLAGDPWTFALLNTSGAPIDVAALMLYFEEATR